MLETEKAAVAELTSRINNNINALHIKDKQAELNHLKLKQADPATYSDFNKLKSINIKVKKIEDKINPWFQVKQQAEDLQVLIEMAVEEGNAGYTEEIKKSFNALQSRVERLELLRLFVDEDDYNNAFLSIQPGAGGTESCDWANMLLRMYLRWAEKKNYTCIVNEYQPGDEAGLKSATLFIQGAYAFGNLKCETGVHRLVRISPFDANKRRHTSFCSIHATAEIDDRVEVEIDNTDLRVDTFRASGAGGQHVNTTDSAVRITHNPTNIVVACQAERSQHQNKEKALKMLRSRLYEYYQAQKEAEIKDKTADKKKIEWGSQIRSYVFHPYNMIKDHRTDYETAKVDEVMDGALDQFIYAYLKDVN
ncbi:MAG TPA: peptide chain release factor 2 [Spirochaetota bacterium]|nr:peptide chain release factor 2 [Spirochaetota bacterium]